MAVFSIHCVLLALFSLGLMLNAAVFTLDNQCNYPIWPATLSGSGHAPLADTGSELSSHSQIHISAPPGWSGRVWARTGCDFIPDHSCQCVTGDCNASVKCTTSGATPTSLAEFTLSNNPNDKDFYDVSLVDGYNVGVNVKAIGGTGDCQNVGCVADLNANCPEELRVIDSQGTIVACRSACATFGAPEFCCTGDHSTAQTCPPTEYSTFFKSACPRAYSYAYDDGSSISTCCASHYLVTFCPTSL